MKENGGGRGRNERERFKENVTTQQKTCGYLANILTDEHFWIIDPFEKFKL